MKEGIFTISIEPAPSIPNLKIITLGGSFDAVASKQIDEKVFLIIEKESLNIILDLSHLEYLNSIGILSLIKYSKFMVEKKRLLKFVKPPKRIYDALGAAGIVRHFDIYDSVEAAISSF
jgi:anti-anti-sigma factor